jgi:hypothetical protein
LDRRKFFSTGASAVYQRLPAMHGGASQDLALPIALIDQTAQAAGFIRLLFRG